MGTMMMRVTNLVSSVLMTVSLALIQLSASHVNQRGHSMLLVDASVLLVIFLMAHCVRHAQSNAVVAIAQLYALVA